VSRAGQRDGTKLPSPLAAQNMFLRSCTAFVEAHGDGIKWQQASHCPAGVLRTAGGIEMRRDGRRRLTAPQNQTVLTKVLYLQRSRGVPVTSICHIG